MPGLIMYLRGPGRANEHTAPHVVAGHDVIVELAGQGELSADAGLDLANALDLPSKLFGTEVTVPVYDVCLLYTSPSPRDKRQSRMPSSA